MKRAAATQPRAPGSAQSTACYRYSCMLLPRRRPYQRRRLLWFLVTERGRRQDASDQGLLRGRTQTQQKLAKHGTSTAAVGPQESTTQRHETKLGGRCTARLAPKPGRRREAVYVESPPRRHFKERGPWQPPDQQRVCPLRLVASYTSFYADVRHFDDAS